MKLPQIRIKPFNKLALVFAVLAVIAIGAASYLYLQNQKLQNPEAMRQAQASRVLEVKDKISRLMTLPSDETPTLMTVTDKDKLKSQAFFKDAENGDLLLIFPQAKKAIIYRESANKIINAGPIAISTDAQSSTKNNN